MRETHSLRFVVLLCMAFFLLANASLSQERETADQGPGALTMTIRPEKLEYDLPTAMSGDVGIIAEVTNNGTDTVFFAHPNICFPHEFQADKPIIRDHTKSHLSVEIETPSGTTTILMQNPVRMFEPGFRQSMTIAPDQTAMFSLGMFGPEYSLGQWNIHEAVFTETGQYQVTVNFRNDFKVAYLAGNTAGNWSTGRCWTGQLRSNTVSLEVN